MNDKARSQKELRLEKGMREKMKHSGFVRSNTHAENHVADLAHRRISEDPLDIPLADPKNRTAERRDRADDPYQLTRTRRRTPQRSTARDEIYARRNHRRGMDQRGNRGRSLHRVGKPGMQGDLRRFRREAAENRR